MEAPRKSSRHARLVYSPLAVGLALIITLFSGIHARAQIDASGVSKDKNIAKAYKTSEGVKLKRGPSELDANEPYLVFTEKGATLTLEVPCHPEKQTYLTVKIWGDSAGGSLRMEPTGPNRPLTKHRWHGPFPGRFYYATKYLGLEATRGNDKVEVTLTYEAQHKNDLPGLEIYDVYTHTEPMFQPPSDELQGEPFQVGPVKTRDETGPSPGQIFDHFKSMADDRMETVLDTQIYGEKWEPYLTEDGGMANGEIPAFIHGGFLVQWGAVSPEQVASYDDPVEDAHREISPEDEDWINHALWEDVYSKYGSFMLWQGRKDGAGITGATGSMRAMAEAYHAEWSKYHQSEELLKRFAAAMDFFVIAQGKAGRFRGPLTTWVGAPNRSDYYSPTWNSGQEALYKAYEMLHDPLDEHGLLDKTVDHDQRARTPEVPRRQAYAVMAARSIDFFIRSAESDRITNQYYLSLHPAFPTASTLGLLSPERAAKEKELLNKILVAAGLKPGPDGTYLFSPKGLSYESGFSAGYGEGNPKSIGRLAIAAENGRLGIADRIRKRAHDAYESYAHFLYLGNGPDGHRRLNKVEWISSRDFSGIPGSQEYFRDRAVLEHLDIPAAERSYELFLEHNRNPQAEVFDPAQRQGKKPYNVVRAAMRWANRAQSAKEAGGWRQSVSTDYRLPDEREGPTAFADEYMLAAALRYKDETLFVNFQNAGKATLRLKSPEFDRIAQVPFKDKGPTLNGRLHGARGAAVKWLQYGPYLVVLNAADKSFSYPVPKPMVGKRAIDLKSKRTGRLPHKQTIAAESSHTFVVPALR